MCGIIGYYDYTYQQGAPSVEIDAWVDMLAHRGPDGRGVYTAQGIGLGHRRLSIIDLSDRAKQPMSCLDGQLWISYNGEIYNFLEIRKELEGLGHHFRTTSDTEVLLHAYLEWELECVHMIKGIFAFAIWDARYCRLWLVRDHIGVKPLYFSDYNGTVYFASEITPLLAIPEIPKDPDLLGLDAYFTYSYVPAPRTGYKHIQQLLPAHYIMFEQGQKKTAQYWDISLETAKTTAPERECIEEFDHLFTDIVKQQMVSDVPLGVFLSSGTDSFAVTRAMQKCQSNTILAFSIGFDNKLYDEISSTEMAANVLNVDLFSRQVGNNHNPFLETIASHCQEPFADSSCLAVFFLSQLAAEHVKVALSGDGADELLAGYILYQANKYANIYRRIPEFIRRGCIKPIAYWFPDIGGKYTWREKARRFVFGAEQGKWRDHATWRVIVPQELKKQMYTPEFYREVKDFDPIELYANYIRQAKQDGCSDLDAYLYADVKFYLPNDMLVKLDRMSMAHSLEVRVPFLDIDIVNFCWRLPDSLKIQNGTLKYILRKVISDIYPLPLQNRPKSGFNMAPYENFLCRQKGAKGFYMMTNGHKQPSFSYYSDFLVQYTLYIFEYIYKKYNFQDLM